ncbi:intradiol ring-cleavage dioxygenase [Archangium lansingense]|uniref:intradiol ring-cleavage dioxygenase n=1 Tax=Archangium lansingense TaxID=2995310 RepID=UPI003B7EC5E5
MSKDSHEHDKGLEHDLQTLGKMTGRRQLLRWIAGAAAGTALLPLVGCGGGTEGGACDTIPEETAGPYPGDGSNGANALVLSGIVRSDIRSSIAGSTGTAAGVPLTVKLTLVNSNGSCAPLSGYAIYLWHCDRDGKYSMYNLTNENYLRGVQETDSEGTVSFTTIFPGCYSGRMPHIHFEVYPSVAKATSSGNKLKTSQLALPVEACNAAYATTGYSASVTNLSRISFAQDNVFSDGTELQLASVTGSVDAGYVATLLVGIAA